ncbi:MAG: hypothetical protein M1832_000007 [Thelocarpon impressellum]|nr:MAG: hypothetical protein M1832_000007 [Thelocarpon impressellum]
MSALKYLIPVLAAAGGAFAANGCTSPENVIQNQGDATALANCETISGDVIIAPEVAGTIQLDGVQKINGDLNCTKATGLTGLLANDLETIGGGFILTGLTRLSGLTFPQLTAVDSIQWQALGALQNLSFTSTVSKAKNVLISDTQLQSLQGINLEVVDNFNINNNRYLTTMDVQLKNISTSLTVQENARSLVASFPNLQTALNMTFRNCSDVKLPSLSTVNGTMVFSNVGFKSFGAPNVTKSGGISFVGNPELTNISLPLLTTIEGGYQIANNSGLLIVNGFRQLKTVAGALDFSGNFTDVSLPALSDVKGGFNLQTSAEFDCGPFQSAANSGVVKGTFVCAGKQIAPGTAGNPTSSAGSPKKTGAATSRYSVSAFAVVGLSSAVVGLLHLSL